MHGSRTQIELAGLRRSGWAGAPWRLAAALLVIAAALAGVAIGASRLPYGMEPALVHLLRFMAIMKAGVALGATVLADWRLRESGSVAAKCGLVASTALMALAPGLVWGLSQVLAGAILFHAALFSFLLIAYADLKA